VPSVIVTLPPYPIVPFYPGVPPLPVPIGGLLLPIPALAFAEAFGLPIISSIFQWGIWSQQGVPLLLADSVFSVDYARDYKISDYPQESGAFQSYNKVQQPYQARVTFLISATRYEFLQNIESACASLQLVMVVTPEVRYPSANLVHYSYERTAQAGAKLIKVEVWLEEVRVTAGAALSASTAAQPGASGGAPSSNTPNTLPGGSGSLQNAQSPSAQPQGNNGVVQPSPNYDAPTGTFPVSNLPTPT
jgi:hypothetical protein